MRKRILAVLVATFLFAAGGILAIWTLVMIFWSEAFKGNRE